MKGSADQSRDRLSPGAPASRSKGNGPPRRVLMMDAAYPPPVVGGKEKQAHLLAKTLVEMNVLVRVLTFRHHGNQTGPYEGVLVQRFRRTLFGILGLLLHIGRYRFRYRILHVHTPSRIGLLVATVGHFFKYRVIFKLPNEGLVPAATGVAARTRIWVYKRIHTIVCLEADSVSRLQEQGISREHIMSVDNGVEIAGPAQGHDPHSQRSSNRKEFLFVGRLVAQKRCDDAINAFAASGLKNKGYSLRILGDGPLRASLEQLVRQHGLDGAVGFEGQHTDVLAKMRGAGCLVLCSDKEGMPNVVLEAMSMGLPVIASRVGAVERLLGPAGEEYTFAAGDISRLALQMGKVADDPGQAKSYGEQLRVRCKQNFALTSIAEHYLERYFEADA